MKLRNMIILMTTFAVVSDAILIPFYPQFFAAAGLTHEHTELFRFAKKGPVLFQSIVAAG